MVSTGRDRHGRGREEQRELAGRDPQVPGRALAVQVLQDVVRNGLREPGPQLTATCGLRAGADRLFGDGGNDTINGGGGDDKISGGPNGNDAGWTQIAREQIEILFGETADVNRRIDLHRNRRRGQH